MQDPVHYHTNEWGIVPFARLQEMASAGTLRPDHLLRRDGAAAWTQAANVPGLFPSAVASSGTGPLVSCERCGAHVSDAAENCPGCGHPQAPSIARANGDELLPCPKCNALNRIRNRSSFFHGACRGCGRSISELHPEELFETQVDQIFAACKRIVDDHYWKIVLAGVAVGAISIGGGVNLIVPVSTREAAFLGAVIGGMMGPFAYQILYYVLFIRGRNPLLQPNLSRAITLSDWVQAWERVVRWKWGRWRDRIISLRIGGAMVFAFMGLMLLGMFRQAEFDKKRQETDQELSQAIADRIVMTKNEGIFSHDILLTSDAPMAFQDCDVTLTVSFATGQRETITRHWPSWAPKESKTVNVSASGRIERVDLTGTTRMAGSTEPRRFEGSYGWKPKAP